MRWVNWPNFDWSWTGPLAFTCRVLTEMGKISHRVSYELPTSKFPGSPLIFYWSSYKFTDYDYLSDTIFSGYVFQNAIRTISFEKFDSQTKYTMYIMMWWHGKYSALLAISERNYQVTYGLPHKGPVMQSCNISLNKLLNKQWSWQRFEMPWHPYCIILMTDWETYLPVADKFHKFTVPWSNIRSFNI